MATCCGVGRGVIAESSDFLWSVATMKVKSKPAPKFVSTAVSVPAAPGRRDRFAAARAKFKKPV